MKKIIFVSTGRCGTKRIFEIIKDKSSNFECIHQISLSRPANVIGNVMFVLGSWELAKQKIYNSIIKKYSTKKNFVCSDPLTAMVIPKKMIMDSNTMIVHILRPKREFATSFFKISRRRLKSFIAHNFIPFWQIGILPLENLLNKKIYSKYVKLCDIKNQYFVEQYSINPNFKTVTMEDIFKGSFIEDTVNSFFNDDIQISKNELLKKSNS